MRGRLLFVAPSAYPLGGLATWLDYLLPGLEARGWEPVLGLAAGRFHDVDGYRSVHPASSVVAIRSRTGSREGNVRGLSQLIRSLEPELVIGVNIADTYAAVARIRDRNGIPRAIMTLHGIQPDLIGDARDRRDLLDAVICSNRLVCQLALVEAGLAPERVYYAPYGVEIPRGADAQTVAARHVATKGSLSHPLRIAYVGRIEEAQKRVSDIPALLAELEQREVVCELLVAGGGPSEAALRHQLEFLAPGKSRFLGVLTPADLVREVYEYADVLLVTSRWETGPIVCWEAMARGVVVVTSAYLGSGLEDGLKDQQNCRLFPIGDAARAAEHLAGLRDPTVRQRLARGGYELVTKRYSQEISIAAWDEALRAASSLPPLTTTRGRGSVAPSGRLDRLFGTALGETVRRITRRRFDHQEPGGEWPHTATHGSPEEGSFWDLAARLDRGQEGGFRNRRSQEDHP